jgi:adenylate kinase
MAATPVMVVRLGRRLGDGGRLTARQDQRSGDEESNRHSHTRALPHGYRAQATMHSTIALLGPPGSGKGTQAARLQEEFGYTPLSTGNLLREARVHDTDIGRRAAEYMDRGDLVPDDLILAIVREAADDFEGKAVLLDGFPRTRAQAEAMTQGLDQLGRELGAAIMIDVPDDVVIERILSRGQGRSDDNPETVRERLRVYHEETEPLVSYYAGRGLLCRVDGSGAPDEVYAQVRRSAEQG